jgi:two-component system sensor histidine kinase KdpD
MQSSNNSIAPVGPAELHIFFGAAPGVGKTWTMVDAAQERKLEGRDVVIGHVDTHDRPEFAGLLAGLDIVPLREVEYHGVLLRELDLNAVLQRKPEIVLIDELAHSNLPGTRNPKRYQDVLELLQAGISVYTTLNVQHVASVAEAVEEITGIKVHEQVPDFILEMATSVRLIDLDPQELLKRLLKRMQLQQSRSAPTQVEKQEIDDFIKTNNLVTLRELALRVAASRVDDDVQKLSDPKHRPEPWVSSSKILLGISASPNSELVTDLRTTWLAVYVENPLDMQLDEASRQRIQKHLHLAKELGAETLTVAGDHVANKLVEVAAQYQISRIVIGRSKRRRGLLRLRSSLADEIIELSDTLDVLILA